jgi:hypothetical protein
MDNSPQDDLAYWFLILEDAGYEDDVETFRKARDHLIRLDPLVLKKAINIDSLIINKSIRCLKELVTDAEKDAIIMPPIVLHILGRAIHYNNPLTVQQILDTIPSKQILANNIIYFAGMRYNTSMGILLTHPKMDPSVWDTYDRDNPWVRLLFEGHRKAERSRLIRFRTAQ